MKRLYLDRNTAKLERTDTYLVRLTLSDGTVLEKLEPRRLFPITDPDHFITLLDQNEKEAAFICALKELDTDSERAITECFAEYYMIPRITHLLHTDEKFGALTWSVDTDRGKITFRIRNRNSDIKRLWGTNRVIVRDSNDNRYEIPDLTALDAHSRHLLFSFL